MKDNQWFIYKKDQILKEKFLLNFNPKSINSLAKEAGYSIRKSKLDG
ncbi:hypothetical protein SAMN03080617_03986, partial [Algoriphagus alkaliphilus]